jgi:hypothetical protein
MALNVIKEKVKRDPTMPSGVWDPSWNDPEVARRVARDAWLKVLYGPEPIGQGQLIAAESLPKYPKKNTEERTFELGAPAEVDGLKFLGGSFGEIFRRYTYGGAKPAVNFHTQGLVFGADEKGRYFVRAQVGRVDGAWDCAAGLVVRFHAGDKALGGIVWEGELNPPKDVEVVFQGQDQELAKAFAELDRVTVSFWSRAE